MYSVLFWLYGDNNKIKQWTFTGHSVCTDTVWSVLRTLSLLILREVLWGRCYLFSCLSHLADEETDRLNNCLGVTRRYTVRAGFEQRSFDSRARKRYAKTTHSLITKKKIHMKNGKQGLIGNQKAWVLILPFYSSSFRPHLSHSWASVPAFVKWGGETNWSCVLSWYFRTRIHKKMRTQRLNKLLGIDSI